METTFSKTGISLSLSTLLLEGQARKEYKRGTHRLLSPEKTLEQVYPYVSAMGITRVANVTGLDRIGLPVYMVCRPNSRSLAVFQGKGLCAASARASGVMEAAESFHAENVQAPRQVQRVIDFGETEVVDVSRIPKTINSVYHEEMPISWIRGINLMDDRPIWVPYDLVHNDYRLSKNKTAETFPLSSNGLASGNTFCEAVIHALCELIERDAIMLWHVRCSERDDLTGRIDLTTINYAEVIQIIEMMEKADLDVAIWDVTSDIGIPTFYALVVDKGNWQWPPLYSASGSGCHPSRDVALLRALTEAAQSRLTAIAGSRDDIEWEIYDFGRRREAIERDRDLITNYVNIQSYKSVNDVSSETFGDDLETIIRALNERGLNQIAVVDLSIAEIGLPVVRAIVPGLEGPKPFPEIILGERAMALLHQEAPIN